MNSDMLLQDALLAEFWLNETADLTAGNIFKEFITHAHVNTASEKTITIPLHTGDAKKIKELCNGSDVLVFNFYATALSILQHKYFGLHNLSFISPSEQFDANENEPGYFIFKSFVNEHISFKELFSGNKEFLMRSLGNRIGYKALEQKIGTSRLENLENIALVINSNECSFTDYLPSLLFTIYEEADCFFLQIAFSKKPFDERLIELFGNNLVKLLHEIMDNIYEPIKSLAFISDAERQLLRTFNIVDPVFSLEKNITELIQEQAGWHPNKIAIQHNGLSVTYNNLEQKTNQLAHYLKEHYAIGNKSLVGVMMDRSIAMAESIIGIWKTGGAYVPMDINFPEAWIKQIIDDSGLTLLLIDGSVATDILQNLASNITIVHLDVISSTVCQLSEEPLETEIHPNDLAYVIYTSGSTGKPKGVMIEHLGMINHIGAKITEMQIDSHSIIAQNAPHTFDISVWQFFAGLAAGGTTVLFDQDVILNPIEFVIKIVEDQVTVLELVPSYLVELLKVLEEAPQPIDLSQLKILILNAETLMPSMVTRWFELYPDIPIVNTYGATEASDDVSHYIMYACPTTFTIPVLKKPIQNFEVHLVNDDLQLVPLGVKGEIILSGPAVGRGYLNDKERTERSFLKGPLPGVTSQNRNYRTGDIGRYLADGTMEFLGRKDAQVKIRGNRIELGEIEHALMRIDAINYTAVLPDQEQQYLVAYYQAEQPLTKEYITNSIRSHLPAYMIPHRYIHLEKMPLTPNGKIDKKALPHPDAIATERMTEYVAPRNDVETKLVSMWQQILGKTSVGVNDNFFELGGHSIKAMKLVTRIHQEFNTKIKLEDVFRKATIEEIGKDISRIMWAKKGKEENGADLTSDKSFIL